MSHKPGYISRNKPLNVRLDTPERKYELMAQAHNHSTTGAEVIKQMVAYWLDVPGAKIPPGPWSAQEPTADH